MSEHLSDQTIRGYRQHTLSPQELLRLHEHLALCAPCRQQLIEPEGLDAAVTALQVALSLSVVEGPEHLGHEQFAAYIDGRLDDVDREIVEGHLAGCLQCAADMRDLRAYRAMMSTYPAQEYRPVTPPTFRERLSAILRLPAYRTPLQVLGLAAAAVGCFYLLSVRPLHIQAVRQTAQARQWRQTSEVLARTNATLGSENDRLHRQADDLQALAGREAALQQENQKLRATVGKLEKSRLAASSPAFQESKPGLQVLHPKVRLALKDGGDELALDSQGRLVRLERLPAAVQEAVKSWTLPRPTVIAGLIGKQGTLMGGSDEQSTLEVIGPVGTVVLTDQPVLRWKPVAGATKYRVEIASDADDKAGPVGKVAGTAWKLPQPLIRGKVYGWTITAFHNDQEIAYSARPPAPEARFRVLGKAEAEKVEREARQYASSPLTRSILYAKAGLLDEAETELLTLVKQNPDSEIAKKILRSVQEWRRPQHY